MGNTHWICNAFLSLELDCKLTYEVVIENHTRIVFILNLRCQDHQDTSLSEASLGSGYMAAPTARAVGADADQWEREGGGSKLGAREEGRLFRRELEGTSSLAQ